jgi:hypothetical protein
VRHRFLGLSPQAADYHRGLLERRGTARSPVRQSVALADSHGQAAVVRARTDALAFETFSRAYLAPLLAARGRPWPAPSPLGLLRRQDVLDRERPPAELSAYPDIPNARDGGDDQGDH